MVKSIVKKVGAQPFSVDEANFFRDDNTILHFKNPEGNTALTQHMPQSRTTPSSLVGSLKQKPSRISYPTSSSNLDPNSTSCFRNSSPVFLSPPRKSPTSSRNQPTSIRLSDSDRPANLFKIQYKHSHTYNVV